MSSNQAAWIPEARQQLTVGPAPTPKPGPGELVIRSHAVAIVSFDCAASVPVRIADAILESRRLESPVSQSHFVQCFSAANLAGIMEFLSRTIPSSWERMLLASLRRSERE